MVTFRGRRGHDGKASLIDGFEVVRDDRVVGFIWPGGGFSRRRLDGDDTETPLTEAERSAIDEQCAKVRKMPSEYGWIGVGEPMEQS